MLILLLLVKKHSRQWPKIMHLCHLHLLFYQFFLSLVSGALLFLNPAVISDSSPPPQPQPSDQHQTHTSLLNDLLSSIEAGDYLRALSSDAARLVLQQLADDESPSADRVYSELLHRVVSFLVSESEDDEDKAYRALLVIVISIAVAAFLAFTQCNMTG